MNDADLHETYSNICAVIWDTYVDHAKSALADGIDTTKLGIAAQLAFLSCAARVAADLGTDPSTLSKLSEFCLEHQLKSTPRWV